MTVTLIGVARARPQPFNASSPPPIGDVAPNTGAFSGLTVAPKVTHETTYAAGDATIHDIRTEDDFVWVREVFRPNSVSWGLGVGFGAAAEQNISVDYAQRLKIGDWSTTEAMEGVLSILMDDALPGIQTRPKVPNPHPHQQEWQNAAGSAIAYVNNDGTALFVGLGNTPLDATKLTGAIADARLSTNVVLLTATQTLTNKTLTSPAINTPVIIGGTINNTPIGGTTRAAVAGTTGDFNSDLTLRGAPGKIKPAANSTTALQIAQADGTVLATFDTTNKRLRVGDATAPIATLDLTPTGTAVLQKVALYRTDGNSVPEVLVMDSSNILNIGGSGNLSGLQHYIGSTVTQTMAANLIASLVAHSFRRAAADAVYGGAAAAVRDNVTGVQLELGISSTLNRGYIQSYNGAGTAAVLQLNPLGGAIVLAGGPGKIQPAADSTAALALANAAGTVIATIDTTNKRLRVGDATVPGLPLEAVLTDATTNVISDMVRLIHRTSGAPSNNSVWGAGLVFAGDTQPSNVVRDMFDIVGLWGSSATDGSQVGVMQIRLWNNLTPTTMFSLAINGLTLATSLSLNNNLQLTGGTLILADGRNITTGTSTGTKIGATALQKIGFWNATPIVQPASTGQTAGFTAGAGAAVDSAATFTGGVGSTAYTLGDIVRHLKNEGLIAA